jgi:hypothetical protein
MQPVTKTMSKQRHGRRSQGETTPETTPQTGSGVAHFSVSEVAQFWMSVDKAHMPILYRPAGSLLFRDPNAAIIGILQASNQSQQCAFARTRGSQQSHQ